MSGVSVAGLQDDAPGRRSQAKRLDVGVFRLDIAGHCGRRMTLEAMARRYHGECDEAESRDLRKIPTDRALIGPAAWLFAPVCAGMRWQVADDRNY